MRALLRATPSLRDADNRASRLKVYTLTPARAVVSAHAEPIVPELVAALAPMPQSLPFSSGGGGRLLTNSAIEGGGSSTGGSMSAKAVP
jgi:hypothetical protein